MPMKDEKTETAAAPPPVEATAAPQVQPATVRCRCFAARGIMPGEQVNRWGYTWEANKSGELEADIPVYDVANGVAAGRWKADGMPETQRSELFLRRQYVEVFGQQPPASMSLDEVQVKLHADRMRREKDAREE